MKYNFYCLFTMCKRNSMTAYLGGHCDYNNYFYYSHSQSTHKQRFYQIKYRKYNDTINVDCYYWNLGMV